jgi:hypothetical protein
VSSGSIGAQQRPKTAGELTPKHDVVRCFDGAIIDGAEAVVLVKDALAQQIRAALNTPSDQQPSEETDTRRGGVAPDEGVVLVTDAVVGAEPIERGGAQTLSTGAER